MGRSTNSEVLQEARGPYSRNHRDFPWEAMILTAAFKSGYLRYGSAEDFFEAGAELIFATISAEGFMFVDAD